MRIEWDPELETGVSEIDKQHKELFKKINALFNACNESLCKDEVGNTMRFLEHYIINHFKDEEKLMMMHAYSGFNAHIAQHKYLIDNFEGLKEVFEEEGATANFTNQIHRVVVDWLIQHIGQVDKAFAKYMQDNKQ